MTTNAEINLTYNRFRGVKSVTGDLNVLTSLTHFFLMDESYQTFLKFKWEAVGKEKETLRRWGEGYRLFFADFKAAYTKEQYEFLLNKVDEFEEFLSHHMNIAEIAVQEADNSLPLDVQMRGSCCWMANLLANDARDFYGEIWNTRLHQPMTNRYIDQVCKASKDYGKRWDKTLYLTDRQIKRIEDSVHVIANKICDWLVEDYKKEIARKNG